MSNIDFCLSETPVALSRASLISDGADHHNLATIVSAARRNSSNIVITSEMTFVLCEQEAAEAVVQQPAEEDEQENDHREQQRGCCAVVHCFSSTSHAHVWSTPLSSSASNQPHNQQHNQQHHHAKIDEANNFIRLNQTVGLTLVSLIDGIVLVVVLHGGFVLLQTQSGRILSSPKSQQHGRHHHHHHRKRTHHSHQHNHNNNNEELDFVLPCQFPSNNINTNNNNNNNNMNNATNLKIFELCKSGSGGGGVVVAGTVSPFSSFKTNLHIGVIAAHAMNLSTVFSSSSAAGVGGGGGLGGGGLLHAGVGTGDFVSWLPLPLEAEDLGFSSPSSLCRSSFFGVNNLACAFDGAPFVYVWLQPPHSVQNQNQPKSFFGNSGVGGGFTTAASSSSSGLQISSAFLNTSSLVSSAAGAGGGGVSASSSPASAANFVHSSFSAAAAAAAGGGAASSASLSTTAGAAIPLFQVETCFNCITAMAWMSATALAAGTSCGYVSLVDMGPRTTRTVFESATNGVRLPVRSAVPAAVVALLVVDMSSASSSTSHHSSNTHRHQRHNDKNDDFLLACMTSRSDFFIVDAHARAITHVLYCDSAMLREPLLVDGRAFSEPLCLSSSSSSSSNNNNNVPLRSPTFMCQETTSDDQQDQLFPRLVFFLRRNNPINQHGSSNDDNSSQNININTNGSNNNSNSNGGGGGGRSNRKRIHVFQPYRRPNRHHQPDGQFVLDGSKPSSQRDADSLQCGSFAVNIPGDAAVTLCSEIFLPRRARQQRGAQEGEEEQEDQEYEDDNQQQQSDEVFGDFLLKRCVGHGAFGEVHLATHVVSNKIFAIKRLIAVPVTTSSLASGGAGGGGQSLLQQQNTNTGAEHALHNELDVALNMPPHPNLLQCHGSIDQRTDGGGGVVITQRGIILSFAFGGSLGSILEHHCALLAENENEQQQQEQEQQQEQQQSQRQHNNDDAPQQFVIGVEVVTWLAQLLSGLAHLHHHGTLHRDVKPDNSLDSGCFSSSVSSSSMLRGRNFCWADFGVSRATTTTTAAGGGGGAAASSLATRMGTIVGTPAWHAPEMLSSLMLASGPAPASAASDVWSLAAMFYCLLTRRPGGTVVDPRDIKTVVDGALPRLEAVAESLAPAGVPMRFLKLLDAMMRVDRRERPTAAQCLAAMRANVFHNHTGISNNNNNDDQEDEEAEATTLATMKNFFLLGGNSVFLTEQQTESYLLYRFSRADFTVSLADEDDNRNTNSNNNSASSFFSFLRVLRERLEFWPLTLLMPPTTTATTTTQNVISDPLTPPKIICDRITFHLPNRTISESLRVGLIALCRTPCNSFSSSSSLTPPLYISRFATLAPLLSVSSESDHRFYSQHGRGETLTLAVEYSVAGTLPLAQWIDSARDQREALRRLNKSFRSLLKFVAFCFSDPALRLPVADMSSLDNLHVAVVAGGEDDDDGSSTHETLVIGRSVSLLAASLIIDAASASTAASSAVLSQTLLADATLRHHASLMSRSTLDVIVTIVDSFHSAFQRLTMTSSSSSASSSSAPATSSSATSSIMQVLCKAIDFVAIHNNVLCRRNRKQQQQQKQQPHYNNNIDRFSAEEEAEPDEAMAIVSFFTI